MTERNAEIKTGHDPINKRVWNKAYTVAQGLWKERGLLPVTHDANGDGILGVDPMIIPLVEGGFIELGRFDADPSGEETVYIEVDTFTKDGNKIRRFGTNLMSMFSSPYKEVYGYDFGIFFECPQDTSQVKIIRYLAGLNPIRKFDWNRIKPKTSEMEIALSLSQAAFEAQKRSRWKTDSR